MIRLLIVDDHDFVRKSLVELFSAEDDFTVVGQCDDGRHVLRAVSVLRPDVVLMDLSMRIMGGLDATRALLAVEPDACVVVLTAQRAVREEVIAAGARDLVEKSARAETLLQRVRTAAADCRMSGSWAGSSR